MQIDQTTDSHFLFSLHMQEYERPQHITPDSPEDAKAKLEHAKTFITPVENIVMITKGQLNLTFGL